MEKFTVSCLLVVILVSLLFCLHSLRKSHWRSLGIPNLTGVPFVGLNFRLYFQRTSFYDHVQDIYRLFQDSRFYGSFDFRTPVIVLRDPELIRELCVKNHDHLPDHKSFVTPEMDPVLGRNLFSLEGQRWKSMRDALSPSFTSAKMKILFALVDECAQEFVQVLSGRVRTTSSEVDLKDLLCRYTLDVIATSAFGLKTDSISQPENEFFKRGLDVIDYGKGLRMLKFLLYRIFPNLMRRVGVRFLSPESDRFFNSLIQETLRAREDEGIVRPDMIDLMLQEKRKEGAEVTNEDIVGQAFIFFLAGLDTVSTLLCCLVHELSMNPEIQRRLREEVEECFAESIGNNEEAFESLKKMKYLDMVIHETLRKYPPLPLTDRVCKTALEVSAVGPDRKPLRIEPGTGLFIPIYGLHTDEKYFENPNEFDPERFSEENKSKIVPYTYLPFGVGPRKCIGSRFAIMETKILMVHILRKFVIVKSDKAEPKIAFNKKSFSILPVAGFWAKFELSKKFE